MLRVIIKDAAVDTAQIQGKSGQFESRSQVGWVALPNGETRRLRIRLQRGAAAYAVGAYEVSDDSFTVSNYGDLGLGQIKLLPAQAAGVRAA